jgi:hypothetical protein
MMGKAVSGPTFFLSLFDFSSCARVPHRFWKDVHGKTVPHHPGFL